MKDISNPDLEVRQQKRAKTAYASTNLELFLQLVFIVLSIFPRLYNFASLAIIFAEHPQSLIQLSIMRRCRFCDSVRWNVPSDTVNRPLSIEPKGLCLRL